MLAEAATLDAQPACSSSNVACISYPYPEFAAENTASHLTDTRERTSLVAGLVAISVAAAKSEFYRIPE
jgi:hypothetical protein